MMTAFAIVLCPSHSFPNLMALVAASAFAPKASKFARTAKGSRNMAILWLAERHKSITRPRLRGNSRACNPYPLREARLPLPEGEANAAACRYDATHKTDEPDSSIFRQRITRRGT